jgi:hypothetical protein
VSLGQDDLKKNHKQGGKQECVGNFESFSFSLAACLTAIFPSPARTSSSAAAADPTKRHDEPLVPQPMPIQQSSPFLPLLLSLLLALPLACFFSFSFPSFFLNKNPSLSLK